jgi:type II secretory pathway component PulF
MAASKIDKFFFRAGDTARVDLYDVIIASLDFGVNIKMIVGRRIEKHHKRHAKLGFIKRIMSKPGGAEMPFLEHANQTLLKGGNFTGSVKGWMTDNEQMLIESGGDGELRKSLDMAKDLLTDIKKVKASLKSSLMYPIILFIVLNVMIAGFAYKMLPILVSLSPPEKWEGSAQTLYGFMVFFKSNATIIYAVIFGLSFLIMNTLSIWTGKIRKVFDSFIPWSIYKEFNAGIFLISLSTLMKSGMTLITSLESLSKQSPRYVKLEVNLMIKNARAAESNSGAINTGFLGDIGDEIEDMSEFGGFEQVLQEVGAKSVDQIIENIAAKGNKVKAIMMLLVFGFVGWGYGTFITISQSITDNV